MKVYHRFSAPTIPRESTYQSFPGAAEFNRRVLSLLSQKTNSADLRLDDETACQQAMEAGVELIIGGKLPSDVENHRMGRVPLLIREAEGCGYFPAVFKYQRVVEHRAASTFEYSTLTEPTQRVLVADRRFRWYWSSAIALQLAHYWLLLQACGAAPTAAPQGGVIGTDELGENQPVISWIDLDSPNIGTSTSEISPLQLYATEFSQRVQIAERVIAGDKTLETEIWPIISAECESCAWPELCVQRLDQDDLSLRLRKTPLNPYEIQTLRTLGVTTTVELAACDLESLLLEYLPLVEQRSGAESRIRSAHHRATLMQAGLELERLTTASIELPHAELEIDIDLETNGEDRVYLWGFWVDDKGSGESGYQSFSSFAELDDAAEIVLARTALAWLAAKVANVDAKIYHYSDYEKVRISRLAESSNDPAICWAKEYAKTHFVDLFKVVKTNFFTVSGLRLKNVASAATGFTWRDSDPSGLNSMRWYEQAVGASDEAARNSARQRILEYNEDDVLATWSLRRWLRTQ